MDWKAERVRALVAAAEAAVQRTRWIFLVLNIGSAILLTAQLNLYVPWVRHVRERAVGANNVEVVRILDGVLWDGLYNVSIPVIGMKYNADDLIVIGTAAMSVLALWFVYGQRRENHCVGVLWDISRTAREKNPDLSAYIFDAIAHHFVFTTTTHNDETYGNEGSRLVSRGHVVLLLHLPWITCLLAVAVQVASSVIPGTELVMANDRTVPPFLQYHFGEQVEAVIRTLWGLGFTVLTAYYCFRAQVFERATTRLLADLQASADLSGPREIRPTRSLANLSR